MISSHPSVEKLTLIGFYLEKQRYPPTLKSLSVSSLSTIDLTALPLGLVSLKLDSLVGLPLDLVRLELRELVGLKSYAGIPPCLQHLVIINVPGPEDFPRLSYLETFVMDSVMTEERSPQGEPVSGASAGAVYTSGESYLADSKCRSKSTQAYRA